MSASLMVLKKCLFTEHKMSFYQRKNVISEEKNLFTPTEKSLFSGEKKSLFTKEKSLLR